MCINYTYIYYIPASHIIATSLQWQYMPRELHVCKCLYVCACVRVCVCLCACNAAPVRVRVCLAVAGGGGRDGPRCVSFIAQWHASMD